MSLFRERNYKNSYFNIRNFGKGLFKSIQKKIVEPVVNKMQGKFDIQR